jgi:hypothetical protein
LSRSEQHLTNLFFNSGFEISMRSFFRVYPDFTQVPKKLRYFSLEFTFHSLFSEENILRKYIFTEEKLFQKFYYPLKIPPDNPIPLRKTSPKIGSVFPNNIYYL